MQQPADAREDRALIVEVSVDDTRYSYQLGTDRVWRASSRTPGGLAVGPEVADMVDYPQCPDRLRACLRLSALQRFLDLPIAEGLLDWQVRRAWQTSFPGAAVRTWNRGEDLATNDADDWKVSEQVAGLRARYPHHPAATQLTARITTPDLRGWHTAGTTTDAHPGASPATDWFDVDTAPPRTLDLQRLPDVQVQTDQVLIGCAAFGPPGRVPAQRTVTATLWDPGPGRPLVTALLEYRPSVHRFFGVGPRYESDERIDSWAGGGSASGGIDGSPLVLDVASPSQPHPLPRGVEHQLAHTRWLAFNQSRQELVARFRADGTGAAQLSLAEQVWALEQPPIRVRLADDDPWLLETIDIDVPGVGHFGFDPCDPEEDFGPPTVDQAALRRLGVVAYYLRARGGPLRERSGPAHAWGIDQGLALAAVGDLRTAADLIAEHGPWLARHCRDAAARDDADYLQAVLRGSCLGAAQVAGDELGQQLRATADLLSVLDEAELDRWTAQAAEQALLVPAILAGPSPSPNRSPQELARNLWQARRQFVAERLLGVPRESTQQRQTDLEQQLRDCAGVGHESQIGHLCQYPQLDPGTRSPDRPLLVELVTAIGTR